jgi:hypothetical protein
MTNTAIDLTAYILSNGKLRSFTDLGGYPVFYLDRANNCLCAECAQNNDEYDQPITAVDINWEDSSLYCDQCSERIESAYAEDEVDKEK